MPTEITLVFDLKAAEVSFSHGSFGLSGFAYYALFKYKYPLLQSAYM